jgi:hypothetical protein
MPEFSIPGVIESLAAQFALFQTLLLAASALHKAARWRQSKIVVRHFGRIPAPLATAGLLTAIGAELCAGALLVVPAYRGWGALLAAAIWVAYLMLIVRAIAEDRRQVDCGCSFGASSAPLGAYQIVRNTALAALAIGVAAVDARGGATDNAGPQLLAAVSLLALYGALDQVMGLRPLRAGEIV